VSVASSSVYVIVFQTSRSRFALLFAVCSVDQLPEAIEVLYAFPVE
jgi:hypothetical protein